VANYVYGIVEDAAAPPSGRGIRDAPLQVVHAEGAAALVSELPAGEQLEFGRDELLVHARVLEEALNHGTVLPMRFGVILDGSDAVRHDLLEAHAEELQSQLVDMAGKVEVRVRATYEETTLMREVVKENPEIARKREAIGGKPEDATYFERINLGEMVSGAVDRKRQADAQAVIDSLAPYAAGVEVGEPTHERVVVNASFLVPREKLKQFEEAVEKVAAGQVGRFRVTFTDPLPPHSFVDFAGSR
jgi:Gas vesicle synthesis protein GvpL/GvpF